MALLAAALLALVAAAAPCPARAAKTPTGPGLGWLVGPGGTPAFPAVVDAGETPAFTGDTRDPRGERPREGGRPLAHVRVRWADVEAQPGGARDWSAVAAAVSGAESAGWRAGLVLEFDHPARLEGGALPGPAVPGSLEAWLDWAREAMRTFAGRIEIVQVGAVLAPDTPAAPYAFLLKQTALAVRAEAEAARATVRVAQAAVPLDALELQRALWAEDVAAYVDVLPLALRADVAASLEERLQRFLQARLRHPPAAEPWAWVEPAGAAGRDWRAESVAVRALAAGVERALVVQPPAAQPEAAAWLVTLDTWLGRGYAPAHGGSARLATAAGSPWPGGEVLGRFVREKDLARLVVYRAEPAGAGERARLWIGESRVRNGRVVDLVTRVEQRAPWVDDRGGEPAGRALAVPVGEAPMAALYEPGPLPGLDVPPEELAVAGARQPTAEEIIARHQEVQRLQDDRLERWTARGRVDFHFQLAQGGGAVDVTIFSNYFWRRGGALEWEQTDYLINGNRLNWKKMPELPLIQPEKVITLPLDLTLDRTYAYRLVGRERVDGREAWVLEFRPADPDAPLSLYRGRVWIDAESFVRLRASVIQTRLEPPVLSNEEIDRFAPHTGPDGRTYWLLTEVDGQQTWNAAGRTFVVRRELSFDEFQINPPADEFAAELQRAYASSNQMLRDTERGFRYLERGPDGSRVVKEEVDTSQLFAGGGAFGDGSTDGVVPLGGVNWFNYDLWDRGIQVNAFFAGALGFFTASKPELGPWRMDVTADASLAAIKFEDKVFQGTAESLAERLETRSQSLALRLGVPVGQFVKLTAIGRAAWVQYFDSDDAVAARRRLDEAGPTMLRFVLPEDHLQLGGTLEAEFNRRGWSLAASFTGVRRSDWQAWGLFDDGGGTFGRVDPQTGTFVPATPEPLRESFSRWKASTFREWYLPRFQKLRAEAAWLDGADLDRFSRYEFSYFGDDRLNGFSGSGVRFDEGLIARGGYAFNLFEVVRLTAGVDTARVDDLSDAAGRRSFTGLGVGANFPAPWKTYVTLNYGRALASDIPELEGEDEFLVLVLKLF